MSRAKWLQEATTPSAHGPDYGYLWWLNTKRKQWPSGPATSFAAIGNGGNIVWIDPYTTLSWSGTGTKGEGCGWDDPEDCRVGYRKLIFLIRGLRFWQPCQ